MLRPCCATDEQVTHLPIETFHSPVRLDTGTFTVLRTGNHQWEKLDVRMPPGGKTTLITQNYKNVSTTEIQVVFKKPVIRLIYNAS
jgi:hypothetical protein